MKRFLVLIPVMPLLALTGCNRIASGEADTHGRYSGIGIYQADGLWKHVQGAPKTDKAQARLDDDSHVIVVVDHTTGEIRQCGNHSGFCIAMTPWTHPASALPAKLDVHADELDAVTTNAANAVEVKPIVDPRNK